MTTQPERMANHWWWRPGWALGRSFYTWHFTFQDARDIHRLAEAYRRGLTDVPGLDLVPDRGLHMTTQGLGFVDEVSEKDARAIADAAAARLAGISEFELTLMRPEVTPEAIRWEAQPSEPPTAVRSAIRDAIADVWETVPERADGFAPHVSIAYSNGEGPTEPVCAALATVDEPPATTMVSSVELIVLSRDNRMYEWEPFTRVQLG